MSDASRLLELRAQVAAKWHPVLTRAAQALAGVEARVSVLEDVCPVCGGPVPQTPGPGRRRIYWPPECRRAAEKLRRNA